MSALSSKADMRSALADVRFGSEADILGHSGDVRFTSESGHYPMQLWVTS
jgi:hypothetical protein